MMGRVFAAVVWVLFCLFSTSATARTLQEYEHTVWRAKEGLGGAVIWTSPVPNGMLLLRTSTGYQLFDGVEFHSYGSGKPPPFADHATALGQRSPAGAIYFVDPATQHLMRAWRGQTEAVEDSHDVPRWTSRFVFDPDGVGWLQAPNHLFRLEGLKVEEVGGTSWGIPANLARGDPIVDARGTVWIGNSSGTLYYLLKGARKFEQFAGRVECPQSALAPDGAIWCASEDGIVVVTPGQDGRPVARRSLTRSTYSTMAFDSQGGFWVTGRGTLAHVADWRQLLTPGGAAALDTDTMTVKDGLSSDAIWSIDADSEGNVWVGTGTGLERFRATRFTPVKLPRRDFGSALLADPDGSLWVGNWDRTLMRIKDGRVEDIPGVTHVSVIRRDAIGNVWVGTEGGVWRKRPGAAFKPVEGSPSVLMPHLTQIAEDDSGTMWVQSGHQLLRFLGGRWVSPEVPGVPPSDRFYAVFPDEQKRLWFAGGSRGPFVLKDGAFREINSPAYAAAVERVHVAHVRGSRVWIGHSRGVAAFDGDEFRPLKLKGDVAKFITGIVETPDGDLWLHGLTKAFRIPADQIEAALKDQPATPEIFDVHDGLRAATSAVEPRPTLVQDAAGRLWFSTTEGLFWLDPHAKPAPAAKPPQALIQAVQVDGMVSQAGTEALLPANPRNVEIRYLAAALGVSDRIRFRYRLQGLDTEWQEVATRRTAYYTQLAPGHYRFEVAASNEQGQWADVPASLVIEVQAAWYQTHWFRAALAALFFGVLWALYLVRVRVLTAQERARTRDIAAERDRIARDLHDTLLQSMQGVILGFQGLANAWPVQHEMRQSIEGQLDRADRLLAEARGRVRDLRTTGNESMTLRDAFELAATELTDTVQIEIVEKGSPRALQPLARDHIYLIGREALLNAVTHGDASAITLSLHFGRREFVLRLRDNGVGIDPAVLASGSRPGHYGLVGMRERAALLGAVFNLRRINDSGTELELRVPAAQAYAVIGKTPAA